jgi:tRNA(adenine34) deaminase
MTAWSDAYGMRLALAQAHEAAAAGEVPVGAVVVKDGQVIASGRNAPIASHDPTAHAEVVALRAAAQRLGNYRLDGCTLYVTLEPCAMCSGAMLHARMDRVVFGAPDPRTGVAGSVLNLFDHPQLNHQTQVTGGVLADECGQLLKDFFKPRRVNLAPVREDALRTPDAAFDGLPEGGGTAFFLCDLPSAQGLRLHVLDTGPTDATQAVLWVHGPDSWSLGWREAVLAEQGSAGGRHIVPDLVGFGRSDKPKKEAFHQVQTHAQILRELCDRLDLTQVQLVGPTDIQPLLQALAALQSGRFVLQAAHNPPPLPAAWRDAPSPDKGYRAGPRALARWLPPAVPAAVAAR